MSGTRIKNPINKAKTKIQLKNEANLETLKPNKQNDMVANNNNYKVSNNKRKTDEHKNKQIHSQIKIHNEHLKNIAKIEKYKKLNRTEHKTDVNITKIDKQKKLNMTEHKTDMNIAKIEKHKKLNMTKHKTDMNITKIENT